MRGKSFPKLTGHLTTLEGLFFPKYQRFNLRNFFILCKSKEKKCQLSQNSKSLQLKVTKRALRLFVIVCCNDNAALMAGKVFNNGLKV